MERVQPTVGERDPLLQHDHAVASGDASGAAGRYDRSDAVDGGVADGMDARQFLLALHLQRGAGGWSIDVFMEAMAKYSFRAEAPLSEETIER